MGSPGVRAQGARRPAGARCRRAVSGDLPPQLLHVRWSTGEFGLSGKDSWVYINGIAQVRTRGEPVPLELLQRLQGEVGGVLPHILSHPLEFLHGYLYRWGILGANPCVW